MKFWAFITISPSLNQWDILRRNLIMSWQWQLCCTAANLIFRFLNTCWLQISHVHDLHFYTPGGHINDTFLSLSGPFRHNPKKAISSHFITSSYKLLRSVLTLAHCTIIRCCSFFIFLKVIPKKSHSSCHSDTLLIRITWM